MRTTTLIALVGTTAAKTATETKASWKLKMDHCKEGATGCTAAICWHGTSHTLNVNTAFKDQCAQFNTDADKCQYGDADATNAALCTSKVCDATADSKKWDNCKTHATTCTNEPNTATCWSTTDAAENCQWGGVDCTPALCDGHESLDKVAQPTAKTGKGPEISAYYWSKQCTYAQVQDMRLKDVATTAAYNTLSGKNTADAHTATATKKTDDTDATNTAATYHTCDTKVYTPVKTKAEVKTACAADLTAKNDAAAKKVTSDNASAKADALVSANTAWMAVADNQDKLQAGDLTACKAKSTDADCKALQTKTDTAVTTAEGAVTTCEAKPAYKALTTEEEKTSHLCLTETTKVTQVKGWQTNVNDALTNSWAGDTAAPWHEVWMKTSFTSADLESDAVTLQTKWDKEHATAKTAVATTDAANKAVGHDATTASAWDAAVAKEAELKAWTTWITGYMTNDWANVTDHWTTWMQNSLTMSDLKADAQIIQAKQVTDLADAKTAWDTAKAKVTSTAADVKKTDAANKATGHDDATATAWDNAKKDAATAVTDAADAQEKWTILTNWVAFGKATITNNWNTTQPWQKTWYDNKCDATKKTTKADMQAIHDATKDALNTANADTATLAAAAVKAKTADTAAKAKVGTTVEEKKDDAADVVKAAAALTAANDAVTANAAKIVVLKARKTFGAAILANTYQAHQTTWMSAKINGADTKADAEATQAANAKALKDHKADLVTVKADIAKYTALAADKKDTANTATNTANVAKEATLTKQIAQESTWVTNGTAELKLPANIKKWEDADAAAKKAAAAKAAADKKAAKTKAAAKKTAKPTEAELTAAVTAAKKAVADTEKAQKTAKCSTTGKDSADCKALATTLTAEKKALATAEADLKAHGGSSVGIIIGCVAVALLLVGGVAYWKHKQNAEKSLNSGGEESAQFTVDDCYKAFVDEEL